MAESPVRASHFTLLATTGACAIIASILPHVSSFGFYEEFSYIDRDICRLLFGTITAIVHPMIGPSRIVGAPLILRPGKLN